MTGREDRGAAEQKGLEAPFLAAGVQRESDIDTRVDRFADERPLVLVHGSIIVVGGEGQEADQACGEEREIESPGGADRWREDGGRGGKRSSAPGGFERQRKREIQARKGEEERAGGSKKGGPRKGIS